MSSPAEPSSIFRQRLAVHGRVQGVGFRPFVYRLACRLGLAGLVGNDSHGAFIEIEGPAGAVELFKQRLVSELPPLARIAALDEQHIDTRSERHFCILTSAHDGTQDAEITPDVALCADCRREMFDPSDRRYLYPFINCTNCGPRYSIIRSVPYDRPGTTMAKFTMCPACQAEYDDPANRRFHAQPNACPVCGPQVWLVMSPEEPPRKGFQSPERKARGHDTIQDELVGWVKTRLNLECETRGHEAIQECVRLLRAGAIVAIKGLGGFHLACRADDDAVVQRLRARKGRESKPLAVMVADMTAARAIAHVDEVAAAALDEVIRPIVLLPKYGGKDSPVVGFEKGFSNQQARGVQEGILKPAVGWVMIHPRDGGEGGGDARISEHVAPGTDTLGLMLPYTPLHELLFAEGLGPVVMTSGNPTAEPLCCDNEEALQRLADIADAFLLHDRDIERRVDDSVVQVVRLPTSHGIDESRIVPIRRARGFAPGPITVPIDSPMPVLAMGAELKSTVCMLAGTTAIVSEHLGELENARAYRHFVATVDRLKVLLRTEPARVAYDLHPDYAATRYAHQYARQEGVEAVGVHHHHAHMVSAMADNGLRGRVLGIICDGTGYGTDGAIWGGELLIGDEAGFARAGHLRYFPLAGGDLAARQTWRPAAGLLSGIYGADWRLAAAEAFAGVPAEAVELVAGRLAAGRLPMTSSLGRLFDAVAFLLGVCSENRHEAEAAMALEAMAAQAGPAGPLSYHIWNADDATGPLQLDVGEMVRGLLEGHHAGRSAAELAWAFHETVIAMLTDAAVMVARREGVQRVVLSGGCFANRVLLEGLWRRLRAAGLDVYTHRQVPTGDGGVSLGQAVCAAARRAT